MRAFVLVLLGAWLAAASCQDRPDHFFGGYTYDPTQDCLDAPGIIDVIAGAEPPPCAMMLRCWQGPDGSIYVTSAACDAPLGYVDETETTFSPCVKALAAYGRAGHSPCPAPADGGGGGVL